MQCGQLRQYANIESYTKTSSGDRGQPVGTWNVLYASVPMGIVELDGRQLELAKQLVASATHKVTIRYIANMLPITMRVNFNGRLLRIEHVGELDFRQRYLILTCCEQKTGASQ